MLKIIDLQGHFLMPGMVDAHRHLIGYTEAKATIDVIVTGCC